MKPKKPTNASKIVYERIHHFIRFLQWSQRSPDRNAAYKKWAKKYARESIDVWYKYDNHAANMAAKSLSMVRPSVHYKGD